MFASSLIHFSLKVLDSSAAFEAASASSKNLLGLLIELS